jgi:hypothetical protein
MNDIFISYTRADRPRARLLADRFEAEGWSVWWDAELVPGDAWSEVVEQELTAARCVVVLWSQVSVAPDKRWVRNEARDGLDRGILVPAMLDAVTLPVEFRGVQAADLVGWGGQRSHVGLQQLLGSVAARLGGTVKAARVPLSDLAPPRKRPSERALRQAVVALSARGQAMGTGFALRGTDLVVTDANIHTGAVMQWRHVTSGEPLRLSAQPMDGAAAFDVVPALAPDTAQDVVLLVRMTYAAATSPIGLADTTALVGETARICVAAGPATGVFEGRITAVGTASPIAGMPSGPTRVEDLIETDIVTAAGSAGAPLLRPDGTLLGVVVAGDDKHSLCVPASRLLERLRSAGFVGE